MLIKSGHGVVVNALLALGFECKYDGADLCLMQHVEAPYLLDVEVTSKLVTDQSSPASEAKPTDLAPALAWLFHQLGQVNCHLSSIDGEGGNRASFSRQDSYRSPGYRQDRIARVTVRARSALAA